MTGAATIIDAEKKWWNRISPSLDGVASDENICGKPPQCGDSVVLLESENQCRYVTPSLLRGLHGLANRQPTAGTFRRTHVHHHRATGEIERLTVLARFAVNGELRYLHRHVAVDHEALDLVPGELEREALERAAQIRLDGGLAVEQRT